jgi:hypothetical protein
MVAEDLVVRPISPACMFILSTRSSGSSALQRRIAEVSQARSVAYSRHVNSDGDGRSVIETLYWTKAASVLGMPQLSMPHSEVPIARRRARRDLEEFLRHNGIVVDGFPASVESIFTAWDRLCLAQGPVLIEKSPHHLYQPAAIDLMERYAAWTTTVEVRFVGLVRNPMDVLYSSWRRFGIPPHEEEVHWRRAYDDLLALKDRHPRSVSVIRYEDLVSDETVLGPLLGAQFSTPSGAASSGFHGRSLLKWRADAGYRFAIADATRQLAHRFGYADAELWNTRAGPWFWHREPRAFLYRVFSAAPASVRRSARTFVKQAMGR